jgi:hypothetical protein
LPKKPDIQNSGNTFFEAERRSDKNHFFEEEDPKPGQPVIP